MNIAEEDLAETNAQAQRKRNYKQGKRPWLKYVITAVVLAVFVVLIGWLRGGFTSTDPKRTVLLWCDAFTVPSALSIGFGLLVLASKGGAFDMLAYGMKSFFRLFKKDPIDRKYGGYYEYKQAQKEKKRTFWYLIIVGGAYMLVAIALLVAYYTAF